MSDFLSRVAAVQAELKAPKGQYNSFGRYKYRSCEDILEAVKPLLHRHGLALTISDAPYFLGERYYIQATATLLDTRSEEKLCNTALARESAEKKGMDESQITGTASSYARKYALNGLLCIDDTKDVDTDEYRAVERNGGEPESKPESSYEPGWEPAFETPTAPKPTCADCGAEISVKVHDYSVKAYKRPLCMACQKKGQA